MAVQMNIAEAKAKLSELVARAEAGEEVVIARDGKPVATLVPTAQASKKTGIRLGAYAHLGPMEDPDLFLRPDPELEALMDASVFPDSNPDRSR
ncbi:MAG: type II toxin-antitoxin system prevent-host-death family antitoxin [Hyphomonadaceae bacterium]|nr:type II toxin-antitoxin system prevent-host-death family antitoxin [Hyphomonadaceae bacterium]